MSQDVYYYYNDIGFPVETFPLWNMLWTIGLLITIDESDSKVIGSLRKADEDWDITEVKGDTPQECIEKLIDYIAKNDLIDEEFK